jgi:hypothetical protein
MEVKTSGCRTLEGNPEGKKPLGKSKHNGEKDLKGWGGMDWIDLAQDRDQ